jgi:hypothetical protein
VLFGVREKTDRTYDRNCESDVGVKSVL